MEYQFSFTVDMLKLMLMHNGHTRLHSYSEFQTCFANKLINERWLLWNIFRLPYLIHLWTQTTHDAQSHKVKTWQFTKPQIFWDRRTFCGFSCLNSTLQNITNGKWDTPTQHSAEIREWFLCVSLFRCHFNSLSTLICYSQTLVIVYPKEGNLFSLQIYKWAHDCIRIRIFQLMRIKLIENHRCAFSAGIPRVSRNKQSIADINMS